MSSDFFELLIKYKNFKMAFISLNKFCLQLVSGMSQSLIAIRGSSGLPVEKLTSHARTRL